MLLVTSPMRDTPANPALQGFTLIELLVVIFVIGFLATIALPAFNAITASQGVAEAAFQTSAALELARQEAVSRSTYVWVALQNQDNSGTSGSQDLRIGLVFSKDGTATSGSANLQPLGRAVLVKRCALSQIADLSPALKQQISEKLGGGEVKDLQGSSLQFSVGNMLFTGTNLRTITFTPRGEAMLTNNPEANTGFDPLIGIGLRQTRGATILSTNDAAVVLDGGLGVPTTFRLK